MLVAEKESALVELLLFDLANDAHVGFTSPSESTEQGTGLWSREPKYYMGVIRAGI